MLSIDIDKFLFSKGDLLFIPADSTYQLQFKKTCSADYYLLPFQLYQTKAINRDTYTKVVLKNEKSILKSFVFQSADTIQPIMEDLFKLEQDESINNHFLKKAKRSMIFHYFVTNQQQKFQKIQ